MTHCKNPKGHSPLPNCYNCHQLGHMIKDCPIMRKGEQDRVYAIKDEPSTSQNVKGKAVLEGNIFIEDDLVRVLFDTGASHSFASKETAEELKLEPKLVDTPISVTNPIGGNTNLCMNCEKVQIFHSSHKFPSDLFILYFIGF